MTALLIIGLVVGAYFIGRLVQWISDAKDAMGSRPGRRYRP